MHKSMKCCLIRLQTHSPSCAPVPTYMYRIHVHNTDANCKISKFNSFHCVNACTCTCSTAGVILDVRPVQMKRDIASVLAWIFACKHFRFFLFWYFIYPEDSLDLPPSPMTVPSKAHCRQYELMYIHIQFFSFSFSRNVIILLVGFD